MRVSDTTVDNRLTLTPEEERQFSPRSVFTVGGRRISGRDVLAKRTMRFDPCSLGLSNHADQITELLTRHIIKAAQHGIRTDVTLYLSVMQEFKPSPQ